MLTRRETLQLASAALLPNLVQPRPAKRVIVVGAGIAGLSCAWELKRRGHDVTVLEASNRTGGHVFTRTFQDHLREVAKWRGIERSRAGTAAGAQAPVAATRPNPALSP